MEINSVKAKDVYNYLDINISFNKDLSFIVGLNGSGKTTAIRILNAILAPSPKDLNLIPFKEASVTLTHRKKQYTIKTKKENGHISLSIPRHIKGKFLIPSLDNEEFLFRYGHKEEGDDYFKTIILENRDNEVLRFILELPSPFFLGLDRKISANDFFEPQSALRHKRINPARRLSSNHYHRILTGNLGSGLAEVQDLLFDITRNIRRVSDRENKKQRNNLILSSFKYTKFSEIFIADNDFTEEEGLLGRRDELEATLKQMDMFGSEAKKEISTFFENIQRLLDKKKRDDETKGLDIEWLINKAQINRIYKFLKIIDDAKRKIDKASHKLKIFLDIVNSYYVDSNKLLSIDPLGKAILKRPKGGTAGLEALSSGEKQILIIFANSILRSGKDKVFIIDEPELSLHLNWQERFVDDIKSLKTGAQFIFATHSPEIIAGYEEKCVEVLN